MACCDRIIIAARRRCNSLVSVPDAVMRQRQGEIVSVVATARCDWRCVPIQCQRYESVDIPSIIDEINHALGSCEGLYTDRFRDMNFIAALFKDFGQVA